MARKSTPEQAYTDAMHTLLNDGSRIDEITATKLQRIVGGQYSKIVKIVDSFKDDYLEKQDVKKTAPLSPWFQELVQNISESVSNQLIESWFTINTETTSSIALASKAFEEKKGQFERKANEDLEQIRQLESSHEQLEINHEKVKEKLEAIKNKLSGVLTHTEYQAASFEASKQEHKLTEAELKQSIKTLQDEKLALVRDISQLESQKDNGLEHIKTLTVDLKDKTKNIKQLQADILSVNKELSIIEGKLQVKDEIIKNNEKNNA